MSSGLEKMIENMPEKTGKSLQEWFMVLNNTTLTKHGELVKHLKGEHGVSHGYANTITTLYRDKGDSGEELVEAQYRGKESLKPICDKIIETVKKYGTDIEIAPKKTSISLRRKKQFALIKPATKSRIDLGLKLKGEPLTDRLQNSGPFGTMCTHRVCLTKISEIDRELKKWLKKAYDMAV